MQGIQQGKKDININIVECKLWTEQKLIQELFYININIVECKFKFSEYMHNICEYKYKHSGM